MGGIVNLRLHRKRQERAQREVQAAENRAKSGRSKDERTLTEARQVTAGKTLDGYKRDK